MLLEFVLGLSKGWLPIGIATRDGKVVTELDDLRISHGRINYISPKKLYEETDMFGRGTKDMSTTIRANISQNSKYWIEKHRYYELKHFFVCNILYGIVHIFL